VVSQEVVIKCNPDHLTLAEYLADNPHPPCPIVGLDNITEFWPGQRSPGERIKANQRPLYHCSLPDCYNEQGTSRQIMQHLMRQYHVESWVKERGEAVPQDMPDLVKLCKKLAGDMVDLDSMKVIMKEELWKKCMGARLRLTKRQAEALSRKEDRNKGAASFRNQNRISLEAGGGSNARPTSTDPVIQALRAAKKTAPRKKVQPSSEVSSPVVNPSLGINHSCGKSDSKRSLPDSQSLPVSSSSSISVVSPPASITSSIDALPTPMIVTSTSTVLKSSDVINVPVNELECAINSIGSKSTDTVGNLDNVSSVEEITMQTLNLSDLDQTVTNDVLKTDDITIEPNEMGNPTRIDTSALNPTEPDASNPSRSRTETTIDKSKLNDITTSIVPPTPATESQKKLSLKEYQEKLRKQRQGSDHPKEEEDIKPFKDDDGIEVIGMKQANVDTTRFGTLEPPVKKEKPSGDSRDLLDTGNEEVRIEATVKAPQIAPIQIFKHHVTDLVKLHLLNYYAKDSNDLKKKNGELKDIKIKTENEFMEYCKSYSRKFQSDILEAYTAINGSIDGIEKENVKQYGIGFEIDKYFSQK